MGVCSLNLTCGGKYLMKLQKLSLVSRRKAMALIAGTSIAINIPSISQAAENKALKRINEITNNKGAKELDIFLMYQKLPKMVIRLK